MIWVVLRYIGELSDVGFGRRKCDCTECVHDIEYSGQCLQQGRVLCPMPHVLIFFFLPDPREEVLDCRFSWELKGPIPEEWVLVHVPYPQPQSGPKCGDLSLQNMGCGGRGWLTSPIPG